MQDKAFPPLLNLGGCRRGRLSDLMRWEGAPESEIPTGADDLYLTDRQIAARYNVHRSTIWRWASAGEVA